MIREVSYLSQASAESMRPLPREGIISITGQGYPRAKLRRGWRRILRLVFDDVERPVAGAVPFGESHADTLIHWLDGVETHIDSVFVHCHAGRHRSAALAKFIAERYDLSGGVRVCEDCNRRVYRMLRLQWQKRKRSLGAGRSAI